MKRERFFGKLVLVLLTFALTLVVTRDVKSVYAADSDIGDDWDYAYIRVINEDGSSKFVYSLSEAETLEDHLTGAVSKKVKGVTYSAKTNTLTLKNYSGHILNIIEMGPDFKIKLVGENTLDGISLVAGNPYWDAKNVNWGCGVTFTGSGSLKVNGVWFNYAGAEASEDAIDWGYGTAAGIFIDANGTKTKLKFSGKVNATVNAPKGGNAIVINETPSSKAFTCSSTLKKSGGKVSKTKSVNHLSKQPVDMTSYYVLYKTDGKNVDRSTEYYELGFHGVYYILDYDALDSLGWECDSARLEELAAYCEAEGTYKPENGGFVYATTETVYTYRSTKNKAVEISLK